MDTYGIQTRAIHSGVSPKRNRGSTAIPIFNSSSFAFDSAEDLEKAFAGRHPGYIYSRITNPTVSAFEERMAAIEGGIGAFATASGMAAVFAIFQALTESGSTAIFSRSLFGGTLLFLRDIANRSGINTIFVDLDDEHALRTALQTQPRFLFFETLGNPKLDVPPIVESVKFAAEYGVPTIIDATLSSPALFDAKAAGAAAVLHSTTKYISGSGTVIGGVITDLGKFDWTSHQSSAIRQSADDVGNERALVATIRRQSGLDAGLVMSPFTAFLCALGIETLPLRMKAHVENATALGSYLANHPKVGSVRYPGLEGDLYYDRSRGYFRNGRGAGALLTFDLGSKKAAFRFIDRLKLVMRASNLGDAKTLALHPESTIFHDCTPEECAYSGVTEGLIRVSVGIEDIADIIDDFDQALAGMEAKE